MAQGEQSLDERRSAVERAMNAFGDDVLRLAIARTGNAADAQDVCQTVFLRLFERCEPFSGAEHCRAWLLRVAVNACADVRRNARKRSFAPLEEAAAVPASGDDARDEAVLLAVAALPPSQRTAVHLFYYEGLSTGEIAQVTGERPATVRSHLHRARKVLAKTLGGLR